MFEAQFAYGRFEPFAGLDELGLAAGLQRFEAAIAELRAVPLARLELAADFAQLFLLDARTGALPYASAYASGEGTAPLYGEAEARMRTVLAAHGLAIQPEFREPADHLAIPLALIADLARRDAARPDIPAAAGQQAEALRSLLLDWLPRFADRCQQARPRFDVYPALAALLLGFVQADLQFLDVLAAGAAAKGATA